MNVEDAINALKKGEIVLIFDRDGREEETDLVIASQFVSPEHIRNMRKDGGGLICTAMSYDVAERLRLPFITDVFRKSSEQFPVLKSLEPNDIPYDEKSSFSITINHRKTFTGITDRDRALTIFQLSKLLQNGGDLRREFGKNFRSPGHVILLKAADGLLKSRQGHTELSVALTGLAGLQPVATICEMMGDSGYALSYEDAKRYAKRNSLIFIEGSEIIDYYLMAGVEKTL